jgi:hypothetical protein
LLPGQPNLMDAALCELEINFEPNPSVCSPSSAIEDPADIYEVAKVGRGTGRTEGLLEAVNVKGAYFDVPQLGVLMFDDLIEIRGNGQPFSRRGDSGAVVTGVGEESHVGVGLIVGGNPAKRLGYAAPLSAALDAFGATLVQGD